MYVQTWNAVAGMFILLAVMATPGCNPAGTAVKIGVQLVGKVVEDQETDRLANDLIGQNPAAADAQLGQRQDTLRDVNYPREWLIYPVKIDITGGRKYVVEANRGRIVSVMMADRNSRKLDYPRKIYYQEKFKGKTPQECQAGLNMGYPLMTVRSVKTGELGQMYDARMVEGMGGMQYCVVKYDANNRCREINLVELSASSDGQ